MLGPMQGEALMPDKNPFDRYLLELRKTPISEQTEHTARSALEALLNAFAARDIRIQHEPKREADKGAPDFKIKRQGMILGYVEVKEIGANLDKVLKSDQIKRYRTLSDNILITDYLQWIWIDRERVKGREILAYATDLEGRTVRVRPDRAEAVEKLIAAFFSTAPEGIADSEKLALALAARSHLLRDYLGEELVRQEREHQVAKLYGLFQIFRDQVFHELKLKEFADAFAQMLAYGLFLARLNSDSTPVTLHNAEQHVPGSFRLIRELVDFLPELEKPEYAEIRWVVDEVLSIVNGLNLPAIHEDLSFRQRRALSRRVRARDQEEHRLFERDPFIYFYEDYLKAYDPAMRKGRGVYYTPPPIVNFIIRAVDEILKDSFGIRQGLADNRRVTVLDFACGTGTFLLEVFERAFENIGGPETGRAGPLVREHFLRNIFGFEYLIAPYTIAHLKLSQYLNDRGHALKDNERLQVFLTNTLEPIAPQANLLLPAISAEVEAAQAVKDREILVITGNPPYSGHSKNKGAWITAQIAKYREGFPELSKPAQGKWLQDDYVKFIRFAQLKMDEVEEGVVGVITNHSWLDNPTFKGMRTSLMATFDQIYVLDLHGNAKKKERAPDGSEDQNVFDIEQGVAISLFVRRSGIQRGVWHADFWGKRLTKYKAAADATKNSIKWAHLEPNAPDWTFKPQDDVSARRYREFWSIPDIYSSLGDPAPGFATQHDEFAISYTRQEALAKVRRFLSFDTEAEARRNFSLCAQDQWKYQRAKEELAKLDIAALAQEVTYRPFDVRWTIWDRNVAVHRRLRVSNHLLHENLALVVAKNWGAIGSDNYDGASISARPVELNFFRRGGEFIFPVYKYDGPTDNRKSSVESIGSAFRAFIDARYAHHYTPEEILGYIYAVLYAPAYRTRYAEFLRTDFPRIPFADGNDNFKALSHLGWELVQAHLLKQYPNAGLAKYHGKGDHEVETVRYSEVEQAVWLNKTQCFKPVPRTVWDFHIGGYQVLEKYLKSRKGRTLSLDEINHVAAVADVLAFTIDQMVKIDHAYLRAFPSRG